MNLEIPQGWAPIGPPDTIILAAAILVAGAIGGELIARTTRLPRMVGYTLAGWIAVAAGQPVTLPLEGTVSIVLELALALLLFEIGSRVRLRWLRHNPGLMATSLLESLLSAGLVWAALDALDVPRDAAIACALLAMPASAAVAGRVALELGADGQVTQRMTVLTALNTMYAIVGLLAFKGAHLAGRAVGWPEVLQATVLPAAVSLMIALALAAAIGPLVRRSDLRDEGTVLPLLGLILLAVGVARWLGASPLLVPLLAGLTLRNLSGRAWSWPRHFGTAGGVLVLMLFVVVGASWSPETLAIGGAGAVALVLARTLGKGVAVMAFSRWSWLSARQGAALAVTLTPLSATTLVMLSDLVNRLPDLAATVAPIVLSSVVVLELIGPIAVQLALRHAGEIAAPGETRKETR